MAKIYGLFGAMTGKTADVVMAVRNGEQIVRKYQPVVSNPNTASQVAARAKLKLMSQMSAVLAPVIAIARQGAVSPRNLFVKTNYPLVTYTNDEANVDLSKVQLTKSVVGMAPITVYRGGGGVEAGLIPDAANTLNVSRVVYVLVGYGDDRKLRLLDTQVATDAGATGRWPVNFVDTPAAAECYAYAMRDNTETARTVFGNIEGVSATRIAQLIVQRTLLENDVTLTETVSAHLDASNA